MKGNLLIVDDEPHLIGVLEFMLRNVADQIFSATNGPDALKILEEQTIHCVLCDMNLPRMNGLQIMNLVKERGTSIPFIFFTAEENQDVLVEAAQNGALDFLFKPHFKGLEAAVAAGLQGHSHRPSPDTSYGKIMARLSFEQERKFPNS